MPIFELDGITTAVGTLHICGPKEHINRGYECGPSDKAKTSAAYASLIFAAGLCRADGPG